MSTFRHAAIYDETKGRIEMHLESLLAQEVRIGNETVAFEESERIHTENSYKHTIEGFNRMAAHAGLEPVAIWTDGRSFFAVGLSGSGR